MTSNLIFKPWLDELKRSGQGGDFNAILPSIARGVPYAVTVSFSADYSADAFTSSIRLGPDAAGATLADFGIEVGVYDGAAGVTPVTLSLTSTQTAALPEDTYEGGVLMAVYDILRDPVGAAAKYRIVGGLAPITGKVTDI